jgi:membrane associated rhomboid family serine protease
MSAPSSSHTVLLNTTYRNFLNQPVLLGVSAALIVGFLSNFVITEAPQKLGLVPLHTNIARSYIWNLLTASFYETNFVKLLLDVGATALVGANMEMGRADHFCIYIFVTTIVSTVGVSAWSFIRFFTTGIENMLWEPIYGFSGVLMSLIMFQRLRFKAQPVYALFPSVTYDNLPFIVLTGQIILRLCGLRFITRDVIFSVIAIHTAWIYLRFFYPNSDGTIGDKSDEFAYYKLVPPVLQPITLPLLTAIQNCVALTGLIEGVTLAAKRQSAVDHLGRGIDGINSNIRDSANMIRQADVVSERRRAKAIKLLEARLSQGEQGWDDDGGNTTGDGTEGLGISKDTKLMMKV